jgi:hypothetical protein
MLENDAPPAHPYLDRPLKLHERRHEHPRSMSASTTARRKLSVHVGWPHPVPAPRRSTEPDAKTRRGCEPTRAAHPLSPQARECGLRLGPRAPTRRLNAAAQFSPRERAHQTRRPRRGEIMDPRPSRGPQHAQRTRPLALRAAPRGLPAMHRQKAVTQRSIEVILARGLSGVRPDARAYGQNRDRPRL